MLKEAGAISVTPHPELKDTARVRLNDLYFDLRVSLLGLFNVCLLRFGQSDITRVRQYRGQLDTGGVQVNAPWTLLWITGRRLPILIDHQGDQHDRRKFNRLVRVAPSAGSSPARTRGH